MAQPEMGDTKLIVILTDCINILAKVFQGILICQTITVGAPGPRKSDVEVELVWLLLNFSVTADILPFAPACPAIHQPSLHCSESQGPSR